MDAVASAAYRPRWVTAKSLIITAPHRVHRFRRHVVPHASKGLRRAGSAADRVTGLELLDHLRVRDRDRYDDRRRNNYMVGISSGGWSGNCSARALKLRRAVALTRLGRSTILLARVALV